LEDAFPRYGHGESYQALDCGIGWTISGDHSFGRHDDQDESVATMSVWAVAAAVVAWRRPFEEPYPVPACTDLEAVLVLEGT
jgi:hypothetical protein